MFCPVFESLLRHLKCKSKIFGRKRDKSLECNGNCAVFQATARRHNYQKLNITDVKKYYLRRIIEERMRVNIINTSANELPAYETIASAGLDLRASIGDKIVLQPFERTLVKTGLFMEIPVGYEAQVRPRSGLALKHGITVLNAPGTIDADYRGEIGVILINLSQEVFEIESGDRIAQLVFAKVEQAEWNQSETLSETERGEGGFGSTGKK